MSCSINNQHCQHKINETEKCPYLAKIKVTRPNPVDATAHPLYVCFSHLMTLLKHSTGQFIVERMPVK